MSNIPNQKVNSTSVSTQKALGEIDIVTGDGDK